MAAYYCDSSRPDDTGDGTSPASAKKTVAAMRTLMQAGSAGDRFRFIYGGVWYEGGLAAITAQGASGNPMVIEPYGDPADGLPSVRGFLNWTGSGWANDASGPANVWWHAWTGGEPFVFLWNETSEFTKLTWNTDITTTFGADPEAGSFAVDAVSGRLYMASTAVNPNTTGELIEFSGPPPARVYILTFTNSEYWTIRDVELMGANTAQIFLAANTPNTLFGEFLLDGVRSDRRAGSVVSTTFYTDVTARSTITARNCLFQNQHLLQESNIFELSYGSGHVILIEDNQILNNPQAHFIGIGAGNALHWYQGIVRRNFAYNLGDDFVSSAFMHIPDGSSLKIHHNILIHTGDDGAEFGEAQNVHVWNNTIIDTHGNGIGIAVFAGATSCSSKNNLIVNAVQNFNPLEGANDKIVTYSPEVDVDNNLYWQTSGIEPRYWQIKPASNYLTFALYQGDASSPDPNGVYADPQLARKSPTEAHHCRPRGTSPARGAGVNVGLTTDYYGRPVPATPSIGAIEYAAFGPQSVITL